MTNKVEIKDVNMKFLTIVVFQILFLAVANAQTFTAIQDLGANETAMNIIELDNGEYFISGKVWGYQGGSSNFLFAKLNSNLDVLWSRKTKIGDVSPGYDKVYTLPRLNDDGCLILGNTSDLETPDGYADIFTCNIGPNWSWLSVNSLEFEDGVVELIADAIVSYDNQNITYIYSAQDIYTDSRKYYLCIINSDGNIILKNEINLNGQPVLHSLIQAPDGEFIISGYRQVANNNFDAYVAKLKLDGRVLWEKEYGGTDWDFYFDIEINKLGNPVFFGTTDSSVPKGFIITETDWNGEVLRESIIPSPNGGVLSLPHPRMEVKKLPNAEFVIVASGHLADCSIDDYQLYWLDSDGSLIEYATYGTPDSIEFLYHTMINSDGNLVVAGGFDNFIESDLYLATFERNYSGVKADEKTANGISISPNPFQNDFNIHFKAPIEYPVEAELFTRNGKLLFRQIINTNEIRITPGYLVDGIYILKLSNQHNSRAVKICKQ